MRTGVSCLVLLAVALSGREVGAQAPLLTQPLDSGTLIQAHLVGGERVRGRLLSRFGPGGDRIVACRYPGTPCADFALPGRTVVLPRSSVSRLEVAVGSRAARNALVGGLSGIAGALAAVAAFGSLSELDRSPNVTMVVSLTAFGAALGALFGSADVRWGPAP